MSARAIRIGSVERFAADGTVDAIRLKPGVNVLVGSRDTGKTGWLNTISYLLGDTDAPEKALGAGIAEKFASARLQLFVDGEEIRLERRWRDVGAKHKIFANNEAIPDGNFSEWFLSKVGIPSLHFPKGNPYSGATWPELSWRMLFRHVYREERFWNDLADKQPEREQLACLHQFLGAADKLYPKELGEQVEQREKLLRLRARKEQFEDVLRQAATGLLVDPSISNAPTHDAISLGIERLRSEIAELQHLRDEILVDAISPKDGQPGKGVSADLQLAARRAEAVAHREAANATLIGIEHRLLELASYRTTVSTELTRIKRVEVAEELFRPLSVTRCPYCDQKVSASGAPPGSCFVCHQHLPSELASGWRGAKRRLAFEHEQLAGEDEELGELVQNLQGEQTALRTQIRNLDAAISEMDVSLRPARSAIAAITPVGLASTDTKIGQLEERVAQLVRLQETLEQRNTLAREIDEVAAAVQAIEMHLDEKTAGVPFEQMSDAMSDGINEYLSLLNVDDPSRWVHKAARFLIGERHFKLLVGEVSWTKVSAGSGGLVVLAYHYALLRLSGREPYNYPGFALIDFPMTLADKVSIANKENYLVEPFVRLAADNKGLQIIICGQSFRGLKGVNKISLKDVWVQGAAPPTVEEGEQAPTQDAPVEDLPEGQVPARDEGLQAVGESTTIVQQVLKWNEYLDRPKDS